MNFRLLTVAPFFPPFVGGLSNHVFKINTNLAKLGIDITIVKPKHSTDKGSKKNPLFTIYKINSIYLPGWPYSTLKSVSIPIDLGHRIDSIIRNGSFDLVHVHGHHFPISWIALNSAKKYSIPTILTLHGMWALKPNLVGGKSRIEEYFNKYIFKKVLSKSDAVIGLTNQVTNYAKQYENKIVKNFVIPNGVDTEIYQNNLSKKQDFRKKYGLAPSSKVIFFCGRLEEVKGIIEFSKAIKKIIQENQIEILIAGSGSLEKFVNDNLKHFKNVHIMGLHDPDKIHELYIASDIYIIPSKFEGLPLTIIEAMNAGLHIIYTPVGGIPDVMKNYSRKTVLNEVSVSEIAKVIQKVISSSEQENLEHALKYAKEFDWKKITQDTVSVYKELIH